MVESFSRGCRRAASAWLDECPGFAPIPKRELNPLPGWLYTESAPHLRTSEDMGNGLRVCVGSFRISAALSKAAAEGEDTVHTCTLLPLVGAEAVAIAQSHHCLECCGSSVNACKLQHGLPPEQSYMPRPQASCLFLSYCARSASSASHF